MTHWLTMIGARPVPRILGLQFEDSWTSLRTDPETCGMYEGVYYHYYVFYDVPA